MPTGRISGDKIHVTGFTPSTTQEQYYRVVVSGKSTAEKTLGSSVLSNEAVVRRKKLARITLSNGGSNPECTKGGKLNISTVNVKDGTLIVVQYPSFVPSFRIEGNVLYYCLYPNYSTTTPGVFVVAGTDIYGDTVLSNEYNVNNPGGDVAGEIDLYCGTTGNVNISIPGETTRLVLNYDLTGVIQSSVTVNDYSGEITNIVVSTGDTTVTLTFQRNTSSVYGKEYRVTVKGSNQYGDTVVSNEVVITHGKEGSDTEFYIIGNDIEANETSGLYQLFYPSNVIASTIAVYDYSDDTITSEPVLYPGGSPMTVAVTTLPNTTPVNKTLVIYASARTQSNKTLYATGVIIQHTDCYLTIPTSTTDNVGVIDYTNPNHLPSYTQTHSFKYLVKNVQNIGAYVSGGTGTVSVNTSTKTVTVNFSKNTTTGNANIIGSKVNDTTILLPLGNDSNLYNRRMLTVTQDRHIYGGSNTGGDSLADTELDPSTGGNRTFVIVVTGTSKNDSSVRLQAVYRFTQNASTEGGFTLTSGGTMNASIEYNTLSIRLDISYPSDTTYSGFAVSVNTTSPASYSSTLNVYDIRIVESNEGVYLTGKTRVNNLDQSVTYTLQVSAMEAGNVTRYTNAFIITHRTHSVDGSIRFTGSTSRTVDASATTVTGITFDYDNLSFAYVKQCTASDGSYANVTVFDYTGKTLTVEFAQYPSSQKTITIVLGGTSNTGVPCESGMFVITQRSSGSGSITIEPQSVTVGSLPTAFTYHVTYSGVQELDPIYNAGVFADVSNSGARILTTNTTLEDDTYQITFRGRRLSDNVTITETLTVIQEKRPISSSIVISSDSNYYKPELDAYVIYEDENSYRLNITENDVLFSTLGAVITGDNPNVTVSISGERISFGDATDSASTQVYVTGTSADGATRITSNTITFIQALEEGGGDTGDTPTTGSSIQLIADETVPATGGTVGFRVICINVDLDKIPTDDDITMKLGLLTLLLKSQTSNSTCQLLNKMDTGQSFMELQISLKTNHMEQHRLTVANM